MARGWGQIRCLDQGFPYELSIAWPNRHPALGWNRQGYVRIRLPAGNAVTNNAIAGDGGVALQSTPGDLPDSETVKCFNRHPRMEWEIGGAMCFVDVPGADFGWKPAALARAGSQEAAPTADGASHIGSVARAVFGNAMTSQSSSDRREHPRRAGQGPQRRRHRQQRGITAESHSHGGGCRRPAPHRGFAEAGAPPPSDRKDSVSLNPLEPRDRDSEPARCMKVVDAEEYDPLVVRTKVGWADMGDSSHLPVTQLLGRIVDGNPHAASELFPLVYDELRAVAGRILRDAPGARTLQPTALVHEAFIKLSGDAGWDWRGKAQFASLAAGAMRQILLDHVRGGGRQKRSGQRQRITLQGVMVDDNLQAIDLLDLGDALVRLAENHPRPARVVEFRFFAGMNREEIAEVLGVSIRTVNTDLVLAQAWLLRELDGGSSDD